MRPKTKANQRKKRMQAQKKARKEKIRELIKKQFGAAPKDVEAGRAEILFRQFGKDDQ